MLPAGCFNEEFLDIEVEDIVKNGEIIELYEDDYPLPSYLLKGQTVTKRPLHVVAGVNSAERLIIIITAYVPDPILWGNDLTRRKK